LAELEAVTASSFNYKAATFTAELAAGMEWGRQKKSWVIIPHKNTSLFTALHRSVLSWSIQ
jgi:hypothetical protein